MAKKMSKEHKEALARGRRQSRVVRDYLEALSTENGRGGRLDADALNQRIEKVSGQIDAETNPAKKLELVQRRLDYENRLESLEDAPDLEALEKEFITIAHEYSERKGISYSAWRELGVPASTLREAGLPRTDRPPTSG